MKIVKSLALGLALLAGGLGLAATPAQAAEYGFRARPVERIPHRPGPGYAWRAGYWSGGVWIPGFWANPGIVVGGPVVRFGYGPVYAHPWFHARYGHFRR
jgi:hypothetical protein